MRSAADREVLPAAASDPAETAVLWDRLAQASEAKQYCAAWLALQCAEIQGVRAALLVLAEGLNTFVPAAVWPDESTDVAYLGDAAKACLQEKRGRVVQPPEHAGRVFIAYPIELDGALHGAIVLDLADRPPAALQDILRALYWGAGRLEVIFQRRELAQAGLAGERARIALDMAVLVGEAPRLEDAAMALAAELAVRFQCERVAIGLERRGRVRLLALSHAATFDKKGAFVIALENAMEEALDQRRSVSHTPAGTRALGVAPTREIEVGETSASGVGERSASEVGETSASGVGETSASGVAQASAIGAAGTRAGAAAETSAGAAASTTAIAIAQRELGGETPVCSVVLATRGRAIGAITCLRKSGVDDTFVAQLEAIAALAAPHFESGRELRRWFAGRLIDQVRALARNIADPRRPGFAFVALLVLGAVAFLALAKGEYRVSGKAVIEGEVQRAVVAPFDGFISAATVRAGERVSAGQVLATLDDRDLALERQKWLSEREQFDRKYRDALAKRERASSRILSSQLAEAEAQLALVEEKLARTRLTAPYDGVVVSGDLSQMLASPVEKGKLLFEVAPLDAYRVVLKVEEGSIRSLAPGQSGQLMLSGSAGQATGFTVKNISVATPEEGKNVFRVEAQLDGSPSAMRPGMEGVGKVIVGERRLIWIWTHTFFDWLRLGLWRWLP